jgi:hypothetical protein
MSAANDVRGCTLLDHLVGAGKEDLRHSETERFSGLEVHLS